MSKWRVEVGICFTNLRWKPRTIIVEADDEETAADKAWELAEEAERPAPVVHVFTRSIRESTPEDEADE